MQKSTVTMDETAQEQQAQLKLHLANLMQNENVVITSAEYSDRDVTDPSLQEVRVQYIMADEVIKESE